MVPGAQKVLRSPPEEVICVAICFGPWLLQLSSDDRQWSLLYSPSIKMRQTCSEALGHCTNPEVGPQMGVLNFDATWTRKVCQIKAQNHCK